VAKILVVDDDVGNREMLHMMVGYLGYDAVEACNGMEALRLLRASPDPMIVLLDLMMPTMNGLEVLRVIAADPSLVSHHGYILLTASFERALLSEE
jgi:CheY-like chemotaxis protein